MAKDPSRLRRIIITSGDTDGVGLEVSLKALAKLLPKLKRTNLQFILIKSPKTPRFLFSILKKVSVFSDGAKYKNLREALRSVSKNTLLVVENSESPAKWVAEAGRACLQNKAVALVTGPLSKGVIKSAGYNVIGHTELLQRLTKSKHVFMAFLGDHFHVLLATGHVAIRDVSRRLTPEVLGAALRGGLRLQALLPQGRKPIGVIGLNPHAGEKSIIGPEENILFKNALGRFGKSGARRFAGPLVPDVCFQRSQWGKYSLYISPYHDQGLIPFKLVHGQDSGVHTTVGLPFVRTSVDHGTAKDIYGKNLANPNSMTQAITWAIQLSKEASHGI